MEGGVILPPPVRGGTMSKAKEFSVDIEKFEFGIRIYPHKFAIGISLQYWSCIFTLHLSIHLAIFHFWVSYFRKGKEK